MYFSGWAHSFKILRYRIVVSSRQRATQIAIPRIEQFAIFRYQHMDVESFSIDVLIPRI